MSSSSVVIVLSLAAFSVQVHANAFLGGAPKASLRFTTPEEVQMDLKSEIEKVLGHGAAERRLADIEDALAPMFASMPKNEQGKLEHAGVRYALHRLFVQRHAWFIKGLESSGNAWNSTSASAILTDRVPAYVESLFEEKLGGHGLGLHDLAVLAATLEHLIHDEAVSRLNEAFNVHELDFSQRVGRQQVNTLLDTYMMFYILGTEELKNTTAVRARLKNIDETYPNWMETQDFVRDVRNTVAYRERDVMNPFTNGAMAFQGVMSVVDEIGEQYGRWQDGECRALKNSLMKLEDRGTGRVLLSEFYRAALNGAWQFSESVEYLRELGALDESDPKRPSVIIPNYINSPSNCLASSSYYSVCCLDECEGLLGHIEGQIAAPSAEPSQILEVATAMSSSSTDAPRDLPATLVRRLKEVATKNGGKVPLHGRLFAQWLHHAFPRECPFPHVSGTTQPRTADEWLKEVGSDHSISEDDMKKIVSDAGVGSMSDLMDTPEAQEPGVWTEDEELFVVCQAKPPAQKASIVHYLVPIVALGSVALTLIKAFETVMMVSGQGSKHPGLLPMVMSEVRSVMPLSMTADEFCV